MNRNDYVIVLGDFGIWNGSKSENYWLDWLQDKNFTVLFIDGNHENFNILNEFQTVDFLGGKAHKIRDNVFHLLRGHIFDICGKKFFAFGGARSHDISDGILKIESFKNKRQMMKTYHKMMHDGKNIRIDQLNWWKEELPSYEEMFFGLEKLIQNNMKVDYIITHCAPKTEIKKFGIDDENVLTDFFDFLFENGFYNTWIAGHYHIDSFRENLVLVYKEIFELPC